MCRAVPDRAFRNSSLASVTRRTSPGKLAHGRPSAAGRVGGEMSGRLRRAASLATRGRAAAALAYPPAARGCATAAGCVRACCAASRTALTPQAAGLWRRPPHAPRPCCCCCPGAWPRAWASGSCSGESGRQSSWPSARGSWRQSRCRCLQPPPPLPASGGASCARASCGTTPRPTCVTQPCMLTTRHAAFHACVVRRWAHACATLAAPPAPATCWCATFAAPAHGAHQSEPWDAAD